MASSGSGTTPSSGGYIVRRRRVRKDKSSRIGWLLLGVCILGGLAVPLTRGLLPKYKPPTASVTLPPEVKPVLSLSAANFEGQGASRIISGDVRNLSSSRVTNVIV